MGLGRHAYCVADLPRDGGHGCLSKIFDDTTMPEGRLVCHVNVRSGGFVVLREQRVRAGFMALPWLQKAYHAPSAIDERDPALGDILLGQCACVSVLLRPPQSPVRLLHVDELPVRVFAEAVHDAVKYCNAVPGVRPRETAAQHDRLTVHDARMLDGIVGARIVFLVGLQPPDIVVRAVQYVVGYGVRGVCCFASSVHEVRTYCATTCTLRMPGASILLAFVLYWRLPSTAPTAAVRRKARSGAMAA